MESFNQKFKIYRNLKVFLRICIAISISFILTRFDFAYLEAFFYDLRFKVKVVSPTSGLIETVSVDELSLDQLKREPEVKDHIAFLKKLRTYKPRNVIYTIDPSTLKGSNRDKETLADLGEKMNIIYASKIVPQKGLEENLQLAYPYNRWNAMPGPRTRERNIFANDNVTRRMIVYGFDRPTLHTVVAQQVRNDKKPIRGLYDFLGTTQVLIDFKPTGTYPEHSFANVLFSETQNFKENQIVVVGLNELSDSIHYIRTPFSKSLLAMPTNEMHANMLDTLILNRGYVEAPKSINFLITSILSLMILFVILKVRPVKGLIAIFCLSMGIGVIAFIAFQFFQYSINMVQPLLAIFACYYFFIPYRLIVESRQKWSYQRENKILHQVEELKNNFLKMMSHDLKTPLARIQGMADITLNDGGGLSTEQRKAVNIIKDSSQELSELITSILDLGRVENQGVKLHLKSRDINDIILKTVKGCEFSAQKKNIQLITELEPLFSVKIDEHLIKQAITNLVENAIKYSPEDSKVLITSDEVNNQIVVQVADQGIGISESEKEYVFEKFYRSKSVSNKDIKGSGLGLYLTKYFIGLHKGEIQVESEESHGSTFTMKLPLDLNESTDLNI